MIFVVFKAMMTSKLGLLGYNAVWICRSIPTFRRKMVLSGKNTQLPHAWTTNTMTSKLLKPEVLIYNKYLRGEQMFVKNNIGGTEEKHE